MTADPASLTAAVLDEEARRESARTEADPDVPDEALPGVGAEAMPLQAALAAGGVAPVVLIGLAQFMEGFDNHALAVLGPEIQETLGASDAVMGAIGGASGVLFLLGSVSLSSLADRHPRKIVASVSFSVWSVVVFCTGLVQNAFSLFAARLAAGLGQAYQLPVNGPFLVDTYPIQARGRIFAIVHGLQMAGLGLAPLFAGAVVAVVDGNEAWRWAFVMIGLVALPIALATATLREPRRGSHEMRAVLGEELPAEENELPVSLGVAFARLRLIRSFHFFLLGMAALGFALLSVPLFLNLYLEEELGLSAFERGLVSSFVIVPGLVALTVVGRRSDDLVRQSPPAAIVLIGGLVACFGVLLVAGLYMPHVALLTALVATATALSRAAFAIVPAPLAAVIPYRLRSRGIALIGIYVFLFGGFFGAVLTGLLSGSIGERAALTVVVLPSSLIGGALIAYGARFIRRDMALVVEELQEEREEHEERARASGPSAVPVISVRNLDCSYGRVQVLFDVAFDVHRGEILALLGTNGAGKSTLLRVVSGLLVPSRGVVRLCGRTITYADPEVRVKIGIVQLMGGSATFPPLTVRENLRMAGFLCRGGELAHRTARVLELFPALQDRLDTPAGELSGGQRQMLALAMTLIHEPEVLIIDELSLGLAPVVVADLLRVVRELKARGMTMIIVEQSLNVALAVADRAIFMEKGSIRFEGSTAELASRPDLARAVFLGGSS